MKTITTKVFIDDDLNGMVAVDATLETVGDIILIRADKMIIRLSWNDLLELKGDDGK